MKGRLAVAIGLGLGLGCSSTPFECAGDHQCSLAGEPGVCVGDGQCAYPDPSCSSGLSYPLGSMGNQAGECVPSEGSSTNPGSSSVTTDGGTSSSSSPPNVDSGTDESTGFGSVDSGPLECNDPFEPNDTQDDAALLSLGPRCQADWEAFIGDPLDSDWFTLDGVEDCPQLESLTFVTRPALPLCVVASCKNGEPAFLVECDGDQVPIGSDEACCNVGEVRQTAICMSAPPIVHLGVDGDSDAPQCLPYQAGVFS